MGQTLNSELIKDIVSSIVNQRMSFTENPEERIDKKLLEIQKEELKKGVHKTNPYVSDRVSKLVLTQGDAEEEARKIIDSVIKLVEGMTKGVLGVYYSIKEKKKGFLDSALNEAFSKTDSQLDDIFKQAKSEIFLNFFGDTNRVEVRNGRAARL